MHQADCCNHDIFDANILIFREQLGMKLSGFIRCRLIKWPNSHGTQQGIFTNVSTRASYAEEQLVRINGSYTASIELDGLHHRGCAWLSIPQECYQNAGV